MKVSLEGADDLGYWYLSDAEGNSFDFVTSHEEHPIAAAMLGWKQSEGLDDHEDIITDALEWLNEHSGEEFEAPAHVTEYFEEIYRE